MMLLKAPIRGNDVQGSGAFNAPRGSRKHNGIDIACYKGSEVLSICYGKVTKIGYPYNPNDILKGHLRYVQVTDSNERKHRFFYVSPLVKVGDLVKPGDTLGTTQGLLNIYPGITDHYHYEVMLENDYLNPNNVLKEFDSV